MRVIINKCKARGIVQAPASKSCAHRLFICAGLADGESCIDGISQNEDICATADCLRAMGAQIHIEGSSAHIRGYDHSSGNRIFPCRESGSTLRFLLPVSLLFGGGQFYGSKRLIERGVTVYQNIFKQKNICIVSSENNIAVSGKLENDHYRIEGNISSQFISGMLFALPLVKGDSTLEIINGFESRSYVDLTLDALAQSGIVVEWRSPTQMHIDGGQKYLPFHAKVEGDWSNAAFLYALNALGGDVDIRGLNADSLQGDKICVQHIDRLTHPGAEIDLSDCPDLAPILFAVAAAQHGGIFTGTRRLAIKESNRTAAMAEELEKFGIHMLCMDNSVQIFPGVLHPPRHILSGHNDHRIVMALSILATQTGGNIDNAEAVTKSYPEFFETLKKTGVNLTYEN